MKKWKLIAVAMIVILPLVLVACAAPRPAPAPSAVPAPMPAPAPAPAPPSITYKGMPEQAVSSADMPSAGVGELGPTWATERMIVRTGNISLVVEDVPTAIDHIASLAESLDGYVVSSQVWEESLRTPPIPVPMSGMEYPAVGEWKRLAGTISIRVPAEQFDGAMRALRALAVEVNSESTSSKDVTEEYVDLSAKLKNLEATEEQLLKLMEKAEKVEDILNVQRELSKTRGEIEQTRGRMQYLERTSSTSLIEVNLEQAKLDVLFTADKARIKKGGKVSFIGQIAGGFAPYSYEWDFGDGKTSTDRAPIHTYQTIGIYTVSLKVTDDRGNTDAETRTDYITVLPGWNAGNIASGAWNGLGIFCQVLADIIIWLGIFSPVWIIVGGIIYWWYRRKKRRQQL